MTRHLPLFIDLSDRKVVIFGGGSVGERKATLFAQYAKVTIISKDFTDNLRKLQGTLTLVQVNDLTEETIAAHAEGAFLVIPATNDINLNSLIETIAKEQGALVNRVDGATEVIVPSIIQKDNITIAISTMASSPALSRYMREKIEEIITPEYPLMSQLQEEIRSLLKKEIPQQSNRKRILWRILQDEDIWSALKESYEKAYTLSLSYITENNKIVK